MDAKLMNDPDFLQKLGEHIKNNIQDIIKYLMAIMPIFLEKNAQEHIEPENIIPY